MEKNVQQPSQPATYVVVDPTTKKRVSKNLPEADARTLAAKPVTENKPPLEVKHVLNG
jgi:hypothetical protein